ncbi:MAG: trypsin-like peptidase domain-containing protein, partial [Sulfuriferula sp.]
MNVFTSKEVRLPRNPLADDPIFKRFFGEHPNSRSQRVNSLGSGVIVSSNGYILTNHHVVEAADEIQVALHDGRTVLAKVVGSDPDTDLAVLKVNLTGLPAISFAKPDKGNVGDFVLAIGDPFGVGQTVTMGIIELEFGGVGSRLCLTALPSPADFMSRHPCGLRRHKERATTGQPASWSLRCAGRSGPSYSSSHVR